MTLPHLYYVGYLGGVLGVLSSLTGHAYMYLWPMFPFWGNMSALSFAALAIASALQFLKHLCNVHEISSRLSTLINFLSIISPITILIIVFDFYLGQLYLFVMFSVSIIVFLYTIYRSIQLRWGPAYILLLGVIVIIPGTFLTIAETLGFINSTWWTRNTINIGAITEALLLSFALAYRLRIISNELEVQRGQIISLKSQFSQALLKATDEETSCVSPRNS